MQVEAAGARNCILKVSRGFKGETGGCMGLMEADEGSGTAGRWWWLLDALWCLHLVNAVYICMWPYNKGWRGPLWG